MEIIHIVYLSLGTNLGKKPDNLQTAILKIGRNVGHVTHISSIYETKPWGYESTNDFLNLAIALETKLSPLEVLSKLREIEIEMGRTSKTTKKYEDRVIDIDILFYDDLILDSEALTLPHPRMHLREFVLNPLREIAPDSLLQLLPTDENH